jgi:c-di-GMP-binding flagellar brake protein YcgR
MEPFSIGQRLTIVPDMPELGGRRGREGYPGRVEQVREGGLLVSLAMEEAMPGALATDTTVTAFFQRGGARYYFRAAVGVQPEAPLPLLFLRELGEVRRLERRSSARAEVCLQPLEVAVLDGDVADPPDSRSTTVVNISAGGLGLVCRRPIPPGTRLRIAMDLPRGFGRVKAEAQAVRCIEIDLGGVKKWRVGAAFQGMPEGLRDRVAAFVLQQQQLLRRKGLL